MFLNACVTSLMFKVKNTGCRHNVFLTLTKSLLLINSRKIFLNENFMTYYLDIFIVDKSLFQMKT